MIRAALLCGGASPKRESLPEGIDIVATLDASASDKSLADEIKQYDAVVLHELPTDIRNRIVKLCFDIGAGVYLTPKPDDIVGCEGDGGFYRLPRRGFSKRKAFFKRLFDLVVSVLMLVLTLPLSLVIALAIKLCDGGPVFFKQRRMTLGGKEFDIIKFRSMVTNAEADGVATPATNDDARITRVGRFIRATGLDELPQLINIIKGDMSLVGPRPERVEHIHAYCEGLPEFAYRFKVKGGLTGYAQIYGRYDTPPYQKLRLDLFYIENHSFLLDIKLILLTARAVFKKRMQ